MESVLPLKMLGVLAVVLLVSSMNEGRLLSKCELKAQLEAAQFQVVPDNMTVEDLIARLVCRANTSGFNTHLVKFITRKHDDPTSEEDSPQAAFQVPALAPPPPQGPPNASPQNQPQTPPPGQRRVQYQDQPQAPPQGPPEGPIGKSERFAPQDKDRKPPAVWHQYGVFQLNDKLACDSEVVPTRNLCQMNCSALIDDDITDDIACLSTLISTMIAGTRGQLSDSPPVPQKLDTLLVKECRHVVASQYFADCA